MENVNLKLGKTLEGRELYYPFDSRCDNRSILFMGRSGCGKSTAISLFEKQLLDCGKKVIEVDFSDSSIVGNGLGNSARIIDIKKTCSFSPLSRHYNVYGVPESDADFARRIADLISSANRFGARQRETLYRVIKTAGQGKEKVTFWEICKELAKEEQQDSILERLRYLSDEDVFSGSTDSGWTEVFKHSRPIQVLDLSGFPESYRTVIAELLLSDLQNFVAQSGPGKFDFVLVLDECQNLRLSIGMPTAFFLSQGRKYGCGVWLATQSPEYFKREELAQLYQPALVLNFQPNSDECSKICRKLSKNQQEFRKLLDMCAKLQRGRFLASGRFLKTNGEISDYGHLLVENVQCRKSKRFLSGEELKKTFIYY